MESRINVQGGLAKYGPHGITKNTPDLSGSILGPKGGRLGGTGGLKRQSDFHQMGLGEVRKVDVPSSLLPPVPHVLLSVSVFQWQVWEA